jgi:hypothetical protein
MAPPTARWDRGGAVRSRAEGPLLLDAERVLTQGFSKCLGHAWEAVRSARSGMGGI